MKILLTGSTGFLGSNIYNVLSSHHNISTLSRKNADYNYNLETDIPFFEERFDIVIHSAGKAHSIPNNRIESDSLYLINVNCLKNILSALSNSYLPKQFVFISSVSVYGLVEGKDINEIQPLLSKEPYGMSKIECERIISKWCEENNIICTILRLPLIVGDNPPGNLGNMIQSIKKGYYFNISNGVSRKSMVLASDIASSILIASKLGGTYNLTDGLHPTFNELSKNISQQFGNSKVPNLPYLFAYIIALIGNLLGNRFPINTYKLKKITSTLTFDDTKARTTFGWEPKSVLTFFKNKNNDN